MNEYFGLLVVFFLFFSFLNLTKANSLALLLCLTIYCGFRSVNVGTDSLMYAKMFESSIEINSHDDLPISLQSSNTFFFLIKICSFIYQSPALLFISISILFNCILYICLQKIIPSANVFSTLYLYGFSFFYYTFAINGIRNGLSYVILIGSLILLFNKKYLLSGISLFLSASIHPSSIPVFICFILFYYFLDYKVSFFIWVFSLIASVLGFDVFSNAINLLFNSDVDIILHKLSFYDSYSLYKIGFRLDFVIFGGLWGCLFWYRSLTQDLFYQSLFATYLTLNGLHFLFFQMPFNDRIGILSWFLIPILAFYKLDKDVKLEIKILMVLYCLFNIYFIHKYNFAITNE